MFLSDFFSFLSAGRGSHTSLSGGESVDSHSDPLLGQPVRNKKSGNKRDALNQEETETLLEDSGIHDNAQDISDEVDVFTDSPGLQQQQQQQQQRVNSNNSQGTPAVIKPSLEMDVLLPSPTSTTHHGKPQTQQHPPSSQQHGQQQHTPSTQTFPPPRLAPPPKSIGPRVGSGRPQAQPIKFIGLDGEHLSPGDQDGHLSPSSSPGMIKSLKELDNQDRALVGGGGGGVGGGGGAMKTSPTTGGEAPMFKSHSMHSHLQYPRDNNLTADKDRVRALEKSHSEGDKEKESVLNSLIDDPKIAFIDETNSLDDSQ